MTIEKSKKWQGITLLFAFLFLALDFASGGTNALFDALNWVFLIATFYFIGRVHGGEFENKKLRNKADARDYYWRTDV